VYEEIKQKKECVSALAPMEDVTDTVFRQMICELGRPDLFYTEFMNVDGFCSEGKDAVVHRVRFENSEKPVIVQLWGLKPENYVKTIEYVKNLNPDGIDINMGCSVRNVLSHGAGSGLIQTPTLAKEIIDAVKSAAGDIPVSVKTRLGYDSSIVEEWVSFLLEQNLSALTVHGRISKEGYSKPSDWDEIGKIVKLRDEISPDTIIIGNGDIQTKEEGEGLVNKYGLDGYMVGRGIMQNPWLFSDRTDISPLERLKTLLEHINLFEKTWGKDKPLYTQRKYIKMYISNFDGANDIRKELMLIDDIGELKACVKKHIGKYLKCLCVRMY
jgi:nifR3 family TIM-barrel protein